MAIIIVLANLMSSNGELNNETKSRVELAASLDKLVSSEMILLCGWCYRPDCELPIADAMNSYLINEYPDLGPKILCQRHSRDTVGDAIFSRIFTQDRGFGVVTPVHVVTSDYHVPRVSEIFNFVYGADYNITVHGSTTFPDPALSSQSETDSLKAFRSTFSEIEIGDLPSMLSTLRKRHPYYNGETFPRIGDDSQVIKLLRC